MIDDPEEVPATPRTHAEVEALIATATPPHETTALLESAKGEFLCQRNREALLASVAKWIAALMFLLVVLIAMSVLWNDRHNAINDAKEGGKLAECRAVISGNLLIAKAEGIIAGNNYNAILGDALVGAISQSNTPEHLQEVKVQLAAAAVQLREAQSEQIKAIDDERRILDICK